MTTQRQIEYLVKRGLDWDSVRNMTPAQLGREFARLEGRKLYAPVTRPSVTLTKEERRALLNATYKEN
jgi:hypothetical protein